MSLKTKDRCGKLGDEAGMSLKTKEILAKCGNVIENEGLNALCGERVTATSAFCLLAPQFLLLTSYFLLLTSYFLLLTSYF
jgi:hypothetical protein